MRLLRIISAAQGKHLSERDLSDEVIALRKDVGNLYAPDDKAEVEVVPSAPRKPVSATFDGACEPYNPGGHMGLGWIIDGESYHRYIPASPGNTNNVAEYLALIEILQYAIENEEITSLRISGDSQLVVSQMTGEYAVRSPNLMDHFRSARDMVNILGDRGCTLSITWQPRKRNAVADLAGVTALLENGITPADRKRKAKPVFERGRDFTRQSGVEYLTRAQLKERSRKLSQIEKLLGQPDIVERFKIRKRKCATYLYDASRVAVIERGEL